MNIKEISLDLIKRNPDQPRKYFDMTSLEELRDSIIENGVINPISVRIFNNHYQIIAGERRYRASIMAGQTTIPCIILTPNNEKFSILSIVENIQRCDLNFIEEALAYKKLIDEFSLKQEDVARKISKTQSAVANKLRILKLEPDILNIIRENNLTERHARALLRLTTEQQIYALEHIIKQNLNVSKSEAFIEKILNSKNTNKGTFKMIKDVRLFVNTVNKSIKIMKEAGVDAKVDTKQTDDMLTYTIYIPMRPTT